MKNFFFPQPYPCLEVARKDKVFFFFKFRITIILLQVYVPKKVSNVPIIGSESSLRIILTRINGVNMCVVSIHSSLKPNKQEIIFFFFLSLFQARIMASFVRSFLSCKKKKTKNGRTCVPAGMFLIIGVRMLAKWNGFVAWHFGMYGTHSRLCTKWSHWYLWVILLPLPIEPDKNVVYWERTVCS